jgi:hypothetical protein
MLKQEKQRENPVQWNFPPNRVCLRSEALHLQGFSLVLCSDRTFFVNGTTNIGMSKIKGLQDLQPSKNFIFLSFGRYPGWHLTMVAALAGSA